MTAIIAKTICDGLTGIALLLWIAILWRAIFRVKRRGKRYWSRWG